MESTSKIIIGLLVIVIAVLIVLYVRERNSNKSDDDTSSKSPLAFWAIPGYEPEGCDYNSPYGYNDLTPPDVCQSQCNQTKGRKPCCDAVCANYDENKGYSNCNEGENQTENNCVD